MICQDVFVTSKRSSEEIEVCLGERIKWEG